jgi:hypothetical protein
MKKLLKSLLAESVKQVGSRKSNIAEPAVFDGRTVPSQTNTSKGVGPISSLNEMVREVTSYLVIAEQESTKRTDIRAKRDVAIAAIQAQRDVMLSVAQHTFQERAVVLQKQFDVLDAALAKGDAGTVDIALKSMVQVVQSSPFKSIQDMQQALGSKDFVIKLE